MNLRLLPLAHAGRVRLELIAISFVAVLIGVACWIVLSFEEEKFHTEGSELDIRLVAVRPDTSDELYDVEGRKLSPRAFDGRGTNAWGSNMMRRDFLFELPEGVAIQPVSYQVWYGRTYYGASEFLPTNSFTTGRSYAVESSFADNYWHSGFFFGGQRPVEFVNVVLAFYLPERGSPVMRFQGPFTEGVTNKSQSATQQWWKCELVLTGAEVRRGATNAQFLFVNNQGYQAPGSLSFLDREGKRFFPFVTNTTQSGAQWLSRGSVPGLNTNQIAAAEIHVPRTKTFHHVKVRYPERPVLTAPAPRGK